MEMTLKKKYLVGKRYKGGKHGADHSGNVGRAARRKARKRQLSYMDGIKQLQRVK